MWPAQVSQAPTLWLIPAVIWLDPVKMPSHQPQHSVGWNTSVHTSNAWHKWDASLASIFIDGSQLRHFTDWDVRVNRNNNNNRPTHNSKLTKTAILRNQNAYTQCYDSRQMIFHNYKPLVVEKHPTHTRALPGPRKYGLDRVQTRNFLCKKTGMPLVCVIISHPSGRISNGSWPLSAQNAQQQKIPGQLLSTTEYYTILGIWCGRVMVWAQDLRLRDHGFNFWPCYFHVMTGQVIHSHVRMLPNSTIQHSERTMMFSG